jgi:hypothetical protein
MNKSWILLCALGIISILAITVIEHIIKDRTANQDNPTSERYTKRNLFTKREAAFFQIAKDIAIKYGFLIFPKMRLADIIQTAGDQKNISSFNRIKAKHIDFCIVNEKSLETQMLIELDDKTHERADRKKRDEFVNQAVSTAQIPIIHINGYFTPESIENVFQNRLT